MTKYSFITHWQIEAPLENVWNEIYDSTNWPTWWKGVVNVKEINAGKENGIDAVRYYTWKSILPYKLSFSMQLTENELHKKLSGKAFGELQGQGTWLFTESNGITSVTYYWDVYTAKPWMNYLAFLLKPAFYYNHNVVMKWGAICLAKKLNANLIKG